MSWGTHMHMQTCSFHISSSTHAPAAALAPIAWSQHQLALTRLSLSISRMGEVAGGAYWKVWGCLWRMCGWMKLKLCGSVIQIHGKAMQVLQGRSEPPRHSKQPIQPSSHPPSPTPARDMSRGRNCCICSF